MSARNIRKIILPLLLLIIIPSFATDTKALLVLEQPMIEDVPRTWDTLALVFEDHYHNSYELLEEISLFNTNVPQLVDLEIIGQSYLGKNIYSLCITNELQTQQKAKTLVVAQHHGREMISVEIALRFILYLLNNYGIDNQVTDYINTQEIFILPTINPDALDLVVDDQQYYLRKNVRPFDDDGDGLFDEDTADDVNEDGLISMLNVYEKIDDVPIFQYYYWEGIDNDEDGLVNEDMIGFVDLNRNYDMFFRDGNGWDDNTQATRFPGFTAFSEPETQVFRDFALENDFAMAYSLHSGGNATLLPRSTTGWNEPELYEDLIYDYVDLLPESYDYFGYSESLSVINDEPVYPAGVWSQWMYFERDCLVPMEFELYANLTTLAPELEVTLIDNSTHLITEWKEIKYYYGPSADKIDDLWGDVFPAFPYLLENTPRLEVDATLYSIVDRPRSLTNISFSVTNLSPRLHTIKEIEIFNMTEHKVFEEGHLIDADSNKIIKATIPLPANFNNSYEIKIGNDFVGYHHFIYRIDVTSNTNLVGFSIVGLAFIVISFSLMNKRLKQYKQQ
ncbi:MAG: M14 family zinc carboxypeptidase [Candidatus Thorarchaeota archaeon]